VQRAYPEVWTLCVKSNKCLIWRVFLKDEPEITATIVHLQDKVYLKVDLLFPVKMIVLDSLSFKTKASRPISITRLNVLLRLHL
jgi:hypothetical protein